MNIPSTRLADLQLYMRKREEIRLRKEAGEPWPWTHDKILQQYKFTNVKRAHDKTTRAFVDHYRQYYLNEESPHYRDAVKLLYNCGIARYFGTIGFKLAVGYLGKHDGRKLCTTARAMLERGEQVFTGAYIVTNSGQSGPKYDVVVNYLEKLWRKAKDIVQAMREHRSWEAGYRVMTTLPGFKGSGFMAKEVLQDFLLIWEGTAQITDYYDWTPVGLGARRGINRLLKRPIHFQQSEAKYIEEVRALWKQLKDWWLAVFPKAEPLTAHDVQFCLCEFDKYERVRKGQGRPRSKYHPPERS